jgi:hypothetical protein
MVGKTYHFISQESTQQITDAGPSANTPHSLNSDERQIEIEIDWSVVMLRMRNGTSKSPFRPRLSRQPIMPRPPCGRCWTRQKDAEPNIAHKWLDGVSDVLADFLRRLRDKHPSATAKICPDLRLPGTCRPSLRSPWPAA